MSASLESFRAAVLAHYGSVVAGLRWIPLGSGGGFSGARVWRGDADGTPIFALKAWPEAVPAEHLHRIHAWMAQAAHLPFVPRVLRTAAAQTVVLEAGRAWDLCTWMPGV